MRMPHLFRSAACLLFAAAAATAGAVEVNLSVTEPVKIARIGDVVTTGVPFARGAVKDTSRLSVSVGGKAVPAQFIKIAPWPDGSVRWALMDCQVDVPAGGKIDLVVRDDGGNVPPATPVEVDNKPAAVTVSTGPLRFVINKKRFSLFSALEVDGKGLLTGAGRGLVLHTEGGEPLPAGPPTQVKVEQAGPMRAIVCAKGKFPGVHNGLLGYTVRVTAYAGKKLVKVHAWLENDGAHGYSRGAINAKPEWFIFDGLAVELGLGLGEPVRATCEGATAAGRFRVAQRCLGPGFGWQDFRYEIRSGEAPPTAIPARKLKRGEKPSPPPPDPTLLKAGARTDGVVALSGPGGTLTTAVRHFWQNYDKAIELDGTTLRLWLWPTEGAWPRPGPMPRGAWPGEYARRLYKPGRYSLPGSVHKGHELILDFSGGQPGRAHATLTKPLMARATPAYYASTEAAPGLFAPADAKSGDGEYDRKVSAWNHMARNAVDPNGASSLYHARRGGAAEKGFWHGWMDFGDISVFQPPASGPCSLHLDWPWIMLVNYLRMGDRAFLDLAAGMTRHRIDIDQHWSDRDPRRYRALCRLDRGIRELHCGPFHSAVPTPDRNWLAGVVLYYMLTGEPKAYECSLRNYQGIADAWVKTGKRGSHAWPNTPASARTILALCALHDLTGETKYLDEALGVFRDHIALRWKEFGPHLFDASVQIRNQEYHREGLKYCHSVHAFCELHHRTGDKKLMKLLVEGCEEEFPETFYDAPLFLSNLYGYVGHKTGNKDYLRKGVDAFIEGFPESKDPPVVLRADFQWSTQSALLLRSGHILQYVRWKLNGGK